MSTKNTYAETQAEWQRLYDAGQANKSELAHLEGHLNLLKEFLDQVRYLGAQQDQLQASKQEVSRLMRDTFGKGGKVATFIKAGIRERFGHGSEKLVEFGVQPFRGRRRKKATEPEVPVEPTPRPVPTKDE